MKIAFVTTQSIMQSTLIGRIIPIATEIAKMGNDVTLLVHEEDAPVSSTPSVSPLTPGVFPTVASPLYEGGVRGGYATRVIGKNPFTRTPEGKKRKRGVALLMLMLGNAVRCARELVRICPDVIIISKPLPENTLAVMIARLFLRKAKIVLDVDDFELLANVVSSIAERAVLHWSERSASNVAQHIITASPFLSDHMRAIVQNNVSITLIPTGLTIQIAPSNTAEHTVPVITYIGSISSSSGHLVMLLPEILEHVRREIPDAEMLIAGSGDDEQALKQLFAEKKVGDFVRWHGRFSEIDIPNIVSKTAIFIDPIDDSIVNRAKSSFRAMLACASGLPLVTSNIGIRTVILPMELHAKLFANAGDAQQYAERIISLLRAPLPGDEVQLLQEKSAQYSYEKLAKLYYNCLV